MSWNFTGIANKSAEEARAAVEKHTAPDSIKDYVGDAIDGLVAKHGDDVKITITGNGHLCEGKGSADPTTATLEVKKADA